MSRFKEYFGFALLLPIAVIVAAASGAALSPGDATFAAACDSFVSAAPNLDCPDGGSQTCLAMYAGCVQPGTKECQMAGDIKCKSPPCINVNQAKITGCT